MEKDYPHTDLNEQTDINKLIIKIETCLNCSVYWFKIGRYQGHNKITS